MERLELALNAFLDGLLPALVDDPTELKIIKSIGAGTVVIVISTPEVSKLVGKQGRTIKSIKNILGAVCAKHGTWCNVILEG